MFDIGLNLAGGTGPVRWWPDGADYAADFVRHRYMRAGLPAAKATAFAFSRGTSKWSADTTGIWQMVAADVPATTGRGLMLEAAETYYPVNSVLSGAVVGTIGSGGAAPTGWNNSDGGGTVTVDSIGTLNGFPAITLTFDVENSGGSILATTIGFGGASAAQAETWTVGLIYQSVSNSGDTAGATVLQMREMQGSGFLTFEEVVLAGDGSRQGLTHTVANANTDNVQVFLRTAIDTGKALKRTMTIAIPTLTKSGVLSSPMPTTDSGNVIRAADAMSLHVPAGSHSALLTFADGGEQTLAGVGGDVELSNAQAQAIRSIIATPS